jgi:hypothetical protein
VGEPLHGRRDAGWRAWLGPASCAVAVAAFLGFYMTTTVHFDFHYGDEGSGFGFSFASGMDWWYHITLVLLFVAGAIAGAIAGRSRGPTKYLGLVGAAVNTVCALLLALFLGAAFYQGAFH